MIIHQVLHLIHAHVLDVHHQYNLISSPLPCCISLQSPLPLLWRLAPTAAYSFMSMLALPLLVRLCFFLFSVFLPFFCDSALSRLQRMLSIRSKRLAYLLASSRYLSDLYKIEIEVWFCSIIWTENAFHSPS